MGKGRRLAAVLIVLGLLLLGLWPFTAMFLRARRVHDHELASLRAAVTTDLHAVGLVPSEVETGFDAGPPDGSAECGVHAVFVVQSPRRPAGVERELRGKLPAAVAVLSGPRAGTLRIVTWSIASSGKDAWLDRRCSGRVPYGVDRP